MQPASLPPGEFVLERIEWLYSTTSARLKFVLHVAIMVNKSATNMHTVSYCASILGWRRVKFAIY